MPKKVITLKDKYRLLKGGFNMPKPKTKKGGCR